MTAVRSGAQRRAFGGKAGGERGSTACGFPSPSAAALLVPQLTTKPRWGKDQFRTGPEVDMARIAGAYGKAAPP